jgi:hypothetical protein
MLVFNLENLHQIIHMFPCTSQPFHCQAPLQNYLLKTPRLMVLSVAAHKNPQITLKRQEDYITLNAVLSF